MVKLSHYDKFPKEAIFVVMNKSTPVSIIMWCTSMKMWACDLIVWPNEINYRHKNVGQIIKDIEEIKGYTVHKQPFYKPFKFQAI